MVLVLSLEDIPSQIATALDINLGSAQVLISISVFFMVVIPVMIVAKDKYPLPVFIAMELVLLFEVGVGWLPFWVLVFNIFVVVAAVAYFGRKLITG